MLNMDMSNKMRFDYNRREMSDNGWVYKNDLAVNLPFKWTAYKIQPYLYDEIVYDFDVREVNYNEFRSGISVALSEKIGLGIYYLLGHNKTAAGDWTRFHMAAVQINLSF